MRLRCPSLLHRPPSSVGVSFGFFWFGFPLISLAIVSRWMDRGKYQGFVGLLLGREMLVAIYSCFAPLLILRCASKTILRRMQSFVITRRFTGRVFCRLLRSTGSLRFHPSVTCEDTGNHKLSLDTRWTWAHTLARGCVGICLRRRHKQAKTGRRLRHGVIMAGYAQTQEASIGAYLCKKYYIYYVIYLQYTLRLACRRF